MDKPFYRVGYGPQPDWLTPDMLEGVDRGNYIINTKHGVIVGRDYQMTAAERTRREEILVKLHG